MGLSACGKGGSSTPEMGSQQPIIVNIATSEDFFTIDLKTSTTVDFNIVTSFDDDTEISQSFKASWDTDKKQLSVFDENNTLVKIDYDKTQLLAALDAAQLLVDKNTQTESDLTVTSIVSITDKIFTEPVDIKIILVASNDEPVTEAQEPSISFLLPQTLQTDFAVGDSRSLIVKAKKDDGSLLDNATSLVSCAVSSDIAMVDTNCLLTAIDVGDVEIIFRLKDNPEISATLKVTILPPYLTDIYFSSGALSGDVLQNKVELEAGKNTQLFLAGTLSNGQPSTDDLTQWVRCYGNDEVINVTDNCELNTIAKGVSEVSLILLDAVKNNTAATIKLGRLSVTVSEPISVLELKVTGKNSLWVDKTREYILSAKLSNGDIIDDARNLAKCVAGDVNNAVIVVEDNCMVTGSAIGDGVVSAKLIEPQSQILTPKITTQSLTVIAVSDILDSQSVKVVAGGYTEFQFNTDLQTTYKVKLSTLTGTPIDANFTMSIYTSADASVVNCFNTVADGKSALACGVDTTSTAGELYVGLENPNMSRDFDGVLSLSFDDDVLKNDDGNQIFPVSIKAYQLLTADSSSFIGHVSSNSAGANTSRYRTDIENGLLSSASGYQVRVVFEPDQEGNYNFDLSAVKVSWGYDVSKSVPLTSCTSQTCFCRLVDVNSIVCDVLEGGKTDLFVTIFGNDVNGVIPSPATADGELSYTVSIVNTP